MLTLNKCPINFNTDTTGDKLWAGQNVKKQKFGLFLCSTVSLQELLIHSEATLLSQRAQSMVTSKGLQLYTHCTFWHCEILWIIQRLLTNEITVSVIYYNYHTIKSIVVCLSIHLSVDNRRSAEALIVNRAVWKGRSCKHVEVNVAESG